MKKEAFNFDRDLSGTNLIEASAGTGKTYSIAILVLRLIIEKNIEIRNILMVTYTKAAVAELESRIRIFIREAYRYISEDALCEKTIQQIVDKGIQKYKQEFPKKDAEKEIKRRLKKARLYLDETAIFTIHSFCQKTLTEYAFETQQLFTSELITEVSQIEQKAVNAYWRSNITTIDEAFLAVLLKNGLCKDSIQSLVGKTINGEKFIYNEGLDIEKARKNIFSLEEQIAVSKENFANFFESSEESTLENISKNRYAKSLFESSLNDAEDFFEKLIQKIDTGYIPKYFPNLKAQAEKVIELQVKQKSLLDDYIYFLYAEAIDYAKEQIQIIKTQKNILTFDDLIKHLHKAVQGAQADALKASLQNKYRAVFIDEFQDTDKMQYEIFDTLFAKSSNIVFYIGDPKQAIYGFRGADIETYKEAAKNVDNAYTMRYNYRSSPILIKAMNTFFTKIENPFLDKINYELVESVKSEQEILSLNGKAEKPMVLQLCKNKTEIQEQVAFRVLSLLNSSYKVNGRAIVPSDIGILVRKKDQGLEIKKQLMAYNIPAVTIDDQSVIDTEETRIVSYILSAILNPSKSNINKALYHHLTNITKEELLLENRESDSLFFREIFQLWETSTVYNVLTSWMRHYHVKAYLLADKNKEGERALTNLLQIIEILHQKEVENKWSKDALLDWLLAEIESDKNEDIYTKRIESDEDAVKIVTIHKSKGLAYNIVFLPHLDMKAKSFKSTDIITYKNKEKQTCVSMYKSEDEIQLYNEQNEQENRRLIYVAVTRAVYACYIYQNNKYKGSISHFIAENQNDDYIEKTDALLPLPTSKYHHKKQEMERKPRVFEGKVEKEWAGSSFSGISKEHISFVVNSDIQYKNQYDKFIFEHLPKGALVGNFLHEILEKADFTKKDFEALIVSVAQAYSSVYQSDDLDFYKTWIQQVLNAKLQDLPFTLSQIEAKKKIAEMPFFFSKKKIKAAEINALSPLIQVEKDIDAGTMGGFIDLFFEYDGKYYLLDWKSNFLGNSKEDYNQENMSIAMQGNNYHLQYLIYSVAIKRYLEHKNIDFEKHFGGVLYVFLRGCREGETYGIYFQKPDNSLIAKLDDLF